MTEPVSKADELPTAQKLAQHPRWEWQRRMRAVGVDGRRYEIVMRLRGGAFVAHPIGRDGTVNLRSVTVEPGDIVPDLADDATGGIVLGMVRAWGEANDHRLSCVFLPAYHSDGPAPFAGVSVEHSEGVTRYIEGTGPTLGDAAGACLLASWARDAQGAG
jgi:hypothetical protein